MRWATAVPVLLSFAIVGCGVEETADESSAPEERPDAVDKVFWNLETGDCFNLLGVATEASVVEVVSCDALHDAEVVAVVDDPATVKFPGDSRARSVGTRTCLEPFEHYVGASWVESGLEPRVLFPEDDETWQLVHRLGRGTFACFATSMDGEPLGQSVMKTGGILGANEATLYGLREGECFDDPAERDDYPVVEVVKRGTPHDNETFALIDHPAGSTEEYPGDDAIKRYANQPCAQVFEARVIPRSVTISTSGSSGQADSPGI